MSENLKEKINSMGELIKVGGAEVGRKMSAGMTSMSFKMKEFFQVPNQADKLVEDATSESLHHPDWSINLHLCDLINAAKLNTAELVRAIKKRVIMKSPRVQHLALVLLETLVKNCDKAFFEVAAERVLDEMVKLIYDPLTFVGNRDKALMMIEAWGESTAELRYLPVYEETYKRLKSRGVQFPGRDNESLAPIFTPPQSVFAPKASLEHLIGHKHDNPMRSFPSAPEADDVSPAHLVGHDDTHFQSFTSKQINEAFNVARNSIQLLSTVLSSSPQPEVLEDDLSTTLVQQCRQSQSTVQKIVETAGDNEALLFEALNVYDKIVKVLSHYEELKKPAPVPVEPGPAMTHFAIEGDESTDVTKEDALIRKPGGSRGSHDQMIDDDLDEMIFGKKASGGGQGLKKQQQSSKDDLISF
ncbi:hypothetical protein RIF29_32645 [Crotalaria pallida]|uniref:TOM1-like protein 2 n=1 Tax=Crotalaria pallida TaxID=3830 RepID=A0AAN9EJ58_CROPI